MILFHAVTTYQLLECILYRLTRCPHKKAVIAIPDVIQYRWNEEYLSKLIDCGFFDDYFYLPYSKIDSKRIEESSVAVFSTPLKYPLDSFEE